MAGRSGSVISPQVLGSQGPGCIPPFPTRLHLQLTGWTKAFRSPGQNSLLLALAFGNSLSRQNNLGSFLISLFLHSSLPLPSLSFFKEALPSHPY